MNPFCSKCGEHDIGDRYTIKNGHLYCISCWDKKYKSETQIN